MHKANNTMPLAKVPASLEARRYRRIGRGRRPWRASSEDGERHVLRLAQRLVHRDKPRLPAARLQEPLDFSQLLLLLCSIFCCLERISQ